MPFLAHVPALTRRQWHILGLVGIGAIAGQYNLALLSLALPQIQASFTIATAQLSNLATIIRLGALPAFALMLAADRLGRSRLLIGSLVAFSLLTGASAFAPSITVFVVLQFLVHTFVTAATLLAGVIVIEEFPQEARGWGIGALTALASSGGGMAAVLFSLVNVLPWGWRALFLIGLLALLFVNQLHKNLPETQRFQAQRADPMLRTAQPLASLVRAYPGRFIVIGVLIFLVNLGESAAFFYDPAYLQQAHGWQPWQVALLNLSAGLWRF